MQQQSHQRKTSEDSSGQFQILPALTPQQQAAMNKQYHQKLINFYSKNKNYEIDNWYHAIKNYTYQSFYFQLSITQAYVLHCLYYDYQLTQQILQIKNKLVHKINILLQEHKNQRNNGKYFMKLSTRSAKDYCWDYRDQNQYKKAVTNLIKYIEQQKITKDINCQKLNNLLYKFFLINSHKKLMIQSGEDFIRIFSKSQRIITDINDFSYLAGSVFEKLKENGLEEDRKNQKLINVWVREWDDCEWQHQFRTFYNQYKLTGITQYDQRCYFPDLKNRKEEIANKCLDLFQKIKPQLMKIQLSKGVLDFVIKEDRVKVVEINVFDRDARASLFNWIQDQQILLNGPLQVRVLQKQIQISKAHLGSIMGMIDKKSLNVIIDALEHTGLLQIWK